jgi:cyclophilin family peptidyl-prolyl cis-trans isomerase
MPSDKRQRQREGRDARREAARAAQRRRARRRQIVAIVVVVAIVFALGITFGGGDDDTVRTTGTTVTTVAGQPPKAQPVPAGEAVAGDTPCPEEDGSSKRTSNFAKPPPMCIDPARTYTATFETSEGDVVVRLDTRTTPQTANNFVVLARYHYYDGTAIHRTDPSIDIVQGGSPTTQDASDPGPGYRIKDEGSPPRQYKEGDLVMARSAGPDSAGSQYFFVTGPKASALDAQGTYVTFGKVTKGLDVLKKIIGLHQPFGQLGGAPRRVVLVEKVTITESAS